MRKYISILLSSILILMASCQKKASMETLGEEIKDTMAVLTLSGNFENGPSAVVAGKASIYRLQNSAYQLRLSDFSSSNGPDLKVYLSKEIMPINFIKLSNLKSTSGNQVYEIAGMPDFGQYKYVCIHCEDYNHLFGYALLK